MALDKTVTITFNLKSHQFTTGINGVNKQLGTFNRTLGRIGRTMSAFVALFAARQLIRGMSDSVKEFAAFEKGIANIGILLDEERGRLSEFTNTVNDLAINFGVSTQDLLQAGFDIQSAVGDVSKSLDIFKAATQLAVAGGSDVASTTRGLLTLMESYGSKLRGAADAADLLFVAQVKARATIGELASSASKFLPVASQLGINVEELFAVFSQLTRTLGNTREASTALAMLLQNMLKPTEQLRNLSERTWKMSIQRALADKGLIEVLRVLSKAQIEDLGKLIPRQRAIKAVTGLTGDLNTVTKFYYDLLDRNGTTQDKANEQLDTAQKKIEKMTETWAQFKREIGEGLVDTGFIDWLTGLVGKIKDVAAAVKNLDQAVRNNKFMQIWGTNVQSSNAMIFEPIKDMVRHNRLKQKSRGDYEVSAYRNAVGLPDDFSSQLSLDWADKLDGVALEWNEKTREMSDAWLTSFVEPVEDTSQTLFEKLNISTTDWADFWSKTLVSAVNNMTSAFGTFFSNVIVEGMSAGEAFMNLWQTIATSVVNWIGQMIAKLAIFLAMMAAAKLIDPFTGNTASGFVGSLRKSILGFQKGGVVPGVGSGDKIPALLEPGELVVPKNRVGDIINNNQPTVNVSMAGAFILDDPNTVEKLYREHLRERIQNDIWTGRDRFYA